MRIAITTADSTFAAAHETDSVGDVVITVPDSAVEYLTFAGAEMVRFDMAVVGKLPRDWANRYTMYPVSRVR